MLRVSTAAAFGGSLLVPGVEGATAPSKPDCNLGLKDWQLLWSKAKKDYCCQAENKGCETQAWEVSDASLCTGQQSEYGTCVSTAPCDEDSGCHPVNCEWGDWSPWKSMGKCTGLCSRARTVTQENNECGMPCEGDAAMTKDCTDQPEWKQCVTKESPETPDTPCVVADWSTWSPCSGAADIAGQTFRDRTIIHGTNCSLVLKQTKTCGVPDARPCKFSAWQAWTTCDADCNGHQSRLRKIMQEAAHGGEACEGTTWQNRLCDKSDDCKEDKDCVLGDWGVWSSCSDFHQNERSREIISAATGNGAPCTSTLKEVGPCGHGVEIPEACVLSAWGQWESCDRTCGGGQTYRLRHVLHQSKNGGECHKRITKQTEPCNTQSCFTHTADLDCKMSTWGPWGNCSADCGVGVMTRERKVEKEAQEGGHGCLGNLKAVQPCDGGGCAKVDCLWENWEEWGACSRSCGGGFKRRDRTIRQTPKNGGAECTAEDKSESAPCGPTTCNGEGVDAEWSTWSNWGECSVTCGEGYQSRQRDTDKRASTCGKPALGETEDYRPCPGLQLCTPQNDCELSDWSDWTDCSCSCFGQRTRSRVIAKFATENGTSCSDTDLKQVEQCNGVNRLGVCNGDPTLDCVFSDWREWTGCSRTCGGGQNRRTRSILRNSRNNGEPCAGSLKEVNTCSTNPCPDQPCKDCILSEWNDWSGCSPCGGQMYRTRNILQTPDTCGKQCGENATKQITTCARNCPGEKYCAWTEWADFGKCEQRCGATMLRQRTLAMSEPSEGEDPPKDFLFKSTKDLTCMGTQFDKKACPGSESECMPGCTPQNCQWGQWGDWHKPTCEGLSERFRVIAKRSNDCGIPCTGPSVTTRFVEDAECGKQPCKFSDWTQWSSCSKPTDQRMRRRSITQYARNGGDNCEGSTVATKSCSNGEDVQDCALSEWSEWLPCTRSCGGGYRLRHREISMHAKGGGRPCNGDVQALEPCAEQCCDIGPGKPCELSEWSQWSPCSRGQEFRTREVVQHAEDGGEGCAGVTHETRSCKEEVRDCELTEWTDWEKCSKSCDGGQVHQHRKVEQYPTEGGKPCPDNGALMKVMPCHTHPCEEEKACQVGDWEAWSPCDSTCGRGQHTRERKITQYPQGSGFACNDTLKEVAPCDNAKACMKAQDCTWYDWEDWSQCSATCGGGHKTRARKLDKIAEAGGKPCDPHRLAEVAVCANTTCKTNCLDDNWGDWSPWGTCTATCGGGITCRTRGVELSENPCPGSRGLHFKRDCQACSMQACDADRDCMFGDWAAWAPCQRWDDKTCAGYQSRTRTYSGAQGKGARCNGVLKERTSCTVKSDPAKGIICQDSTPKGTDCKLSEWSAWGPCSDECFPGQTSRERTILVQPTPGGKPCETNMGQTMPCLPKDPEHNPECRHNNIDCEWGDWQDWSMCKKCGMSQTRHRAVKVYPQGNGKRCPLEASTEMGGDCTALCETEREHNPVLCAWQAWAPWTTCSATCGAGRRERKRALHVVDTQLNAGDVNTKALGALAADFEMEALETSHLLNAKSKRKEEHMQELFVAFAAGMVTLMLIFGIYRFCGRSRDSGYAPLAE